MEEDDLYLIDIVRAVWWIKPGWISFIKGTVMQIEKALIDDCLIVSEVSWKFRIPSIYNFALIYPLHLLFP